MKTHHPTTYQVVGNADDTHFIRWLGTNNTPTTSLLKRAQHHLNYTFERQALLKILQVSSAPLSPRELARQTSQDHTLMKQLLQRMLNTGEIVSACYYLYTSHDHHPLTGTPFSENNTAIPTTPATLTTLTTPASDPAANLASSPPIPTTPATPATLTTLTTPATTNHLDSNHAITPHTPATPTTLTTLATGDHPNSNFPLPLTTLEHNTLTRLSP
jgi:hypothetical protein